MMVVMWLCNVVMLCVVVILLLGSIVYDRILLGVVCNYL